MTASNRKRIQTERQKELMNKNRSDDIQQEGDNQTEGNVSENENDYEVDDEFDEGDIHGDEEEAHDEDTHQEEATDVAKEIHVEQETYEQQPDEEIEAPRKKTKKKRKHQSIQHKGEEEQPSLLFAFEDHIAHKIWNSNASRGETRIVKVHSHVGTQRLWELDGECQFVKDVVMSSGFYQLILHAHDKLDKVLINAFIERFYPETNTFHLPFGEMMITVDEVVHITGLPSEGKVVKGPLGGSRLISYDDVYGLLGKHLGVEKPEAIMIMGGEKKIRLEWLRSQFQGSKESDSDVRKTQCATAYLLYTIGCLVCGDKSGNKVSVHFLQCLSDLRQVHTYSWATACLSWLLYSLGQTTRKDVQQFSGCMTLLQVWIFEHFPVLRRHNCSVGAVDGDVRASFYFVMEQGSNLAYDLVSLRERIDDLKGCDVVWDCYKGKREIYKFEECALYNGPIICFETIVLYLPQRSLRQFGYYQPIPKTPFDLDKKKLKSSTRSFKAIYYNVGDLGWSEWRNHLLNESLTSKTVVDPSDCDETYMQWFSSVSHPIVTNPKKRTTAPVHENDNGALLVRIKRRLRHIAEFIKSCAPSDILNQVLEKVEQIEEQEPMGLYGESAQVQEEVIAESIKRKKRAVAKNKAAGKKKVIGRKS